MGCTLDRKQCLDFKRLEAGILPNRDSFCFSTLPHTSLLNAGGAIPGSKYKSSTFVGFRRPGSRFLA